MGDTRALGDRVRLRMLTMAMRAGVFSMRTPAGSGVVRHRVHGIPVGHQVRRTSLIAPQMPASAACDRPAHSTADILARAAATPGKLISSCADSTFYCAYWARLVHGRRHARHHHAGRDGRGYNRSGVYRRRGAARAVGRTAVLGARARKGAASHGRLFSCSPYVTRNDH